LPVAVVRPGWWSVPSLVQIQLAKSALPVFGLAAVAGGAGWRHSFWGCRRLVTEQGGWRRGWPAAGWPRRPPTPEPVAACAAGASAAAMGQQREGEQAGQDAAECSGGAWRRCPVWCRKGLRGDCCWNLLVQCG